MRWRCDQWLHGEHPGTERCAMLELQSAQARPDPSGGAGQHAGAVQSRGSMRLAAHRLGARALGAPGGRVAALEWSQMASARRAAGRPGVRGRGPQRLREVCHAVLWCTFLCMECAGGRCGRGWRGERPSRDWLERASNPAAVT